MLPYTPRDPELWNYLDRFPNYAFSTFGRIINLRSNSFLYGYAYSEDYPLKVKLRDEESVIRTCMMHRIIAETFYTGYEDDAQTYFVDGNKHNLHILNLRFVRRGVGQFIRGTTTVTMRRLVTNFGDEYDSVREAAKALRRHPSEVYDVLYGRRGRLGDVTLQWEWKEILPDGYQPIHRPNRGVLEAVQW